VQEAPRSEVSASLRDLNSGSKQLPCTTVIVFGTSVSGQRVAGIVPGSACLKAANGHSGRGIGERAIAVKHVGRSPDAGDVGKPASGIERPRMVVPIDGNNSGVIGSDSASAKQRQLTRGRCARASAYRRQTKILQAGRVIGQVATSWFQCRMNRRASVFAAWRAG